MSNWRDYLELESDSNMEHWRRVRKPPIKRPITFKDKKREKKERGFEDDKEID